MYITFNQKKILKIRKKKHKIRFRRYLDFTSKKEDLSPTKSKISTISLKIYHFRTAYPLLKTYRTKSNHKYFLWSFRSPKCIETLKNFFPVNPKKSYGIRLPYYIIRTYKRLMSLNIRLLGRIIQSMNFSKS